MKVIEIDNFISLLVGIGTYLFVHCHRKLEWVGVAWDMMIQVLFLTIIGNSAYII